MALDLTKLKNRLDSLKTKGNAASKHMWKPKGKTTIRILPYKHNPDNPFIELYFHYGINNKTYLSPSTFGRPDPIVEMANKLKKTGDKEDWLQGRKIEPKLRTYVPILVRGQEADGVKFWGMGKQAYEEILSIISDSDYGDITDLSNGNDIIVDYKSPQECGKQFGDMNIRPRPVKSKAFDPANATVKESVKNMIDLLTVYTEPTYDELAIAMDEWLSQPAEGGNAVPTEDVPAEEPAPTSPIAAAKAKAAAAKSAPVPVDGEDEEAPAPKSAPKSATIAASKAAPAASAQAVSDEFDSIFNSP